MHDFRAGCAGWNLPKEYSGHFPSVGTHLQRYTGVFNAVEINSSFYRPHQPATYERWAASVPDDFSFAVKIPKAITHAQRLKDCEPELDRFLFECGHLGLKLGVLLVQLPPSLALDALVADGFFTDLRARYGGLVACEPRHASWFGAKGNALLSHHQIARVAADPAPVPAAGAPGGWGGLNYYRLHGSPRMYYSAYAPNYLEALARSITAAAGRGSQVWCIFDNTAEGAATRNALALLDLVRGSRRAGRHQVEAVRRSPNEETEAGGGPV